MSELTVDPTNLPEISGDPTPTDLECLTYALSDEGRQALIAEGRERILREARAKEVRDSGDRALTVSGRWTGNTQVPYLRISGQWLFEAGFAIGTVVRVEVKDRELVLSVA